MLAPDHRAVLLDHLRAPAGYRMDAAIATTFSLGFTTALVAPLAFGTHEIRTDPDPITVLEAVRSTIDRLDVFYQGGQALIPSRVPDLVAMLEPMIHPVRRPRPGFLFHPKIWCLRYTKTDSPAQYRLLVSSRNLTDSTAWDAIVRFDGQIGDETLGRSLPLSALIRQLPEWSVARLPSDRLRRITDLANEVARVSWTLEDPTVQGFDFFTLGVPGAERRPDFSGERHLVIAPFINAAGIHRIAEGTTKLCVVSNPESLDALDEPLRSALRKEDNAFTIAPDALLPAVDESDDTAGISAEHSGLHAKVVVIDRHHGYGRRTSHVFSGSANATGSALDGNVEFVAELIGKPGDLGVDQFLGERSRFRQLLQRYQPAEQRLDHPEQEALHKLRNVLRYWSENQLQLTMESTADAWTLHLGSAAEINVRSDHSLEITLLSHPGPLREHRQGHLELHFENVPLVDVSPFVVFRLRDGEGLEAGTVMQATLINDDRDNRLDAILVRQVDTREKFLRYLNLLLGQGDIDVWLANERTSGGAQSGWAEALASGSGLLEMLLHAVAERSDGLADLDGLVGRLQETSEGREVLPDGFSELWAVIRGVAKLTRKTRR